MCAPFGGHFMQGKYWQWLLGAVCAVTLCLLTSASAHAQSGSQGTIVITVVDPSGGAVPGAVLTLTELATNDMRTAKSGNNGTYTFVDLPIGTYRLSVAKGGYATGVFDAVLVQASQTTTINAPIRVGEASETVRVTAESSPVLETSSNAIGMVVDMKQIEDLPLQGRDLTAFSQLVAGYNGAYNGLPVVDQGSNIDGVIGNSSRMKFTGNVQPAVSARLEDIAEMTVQTDQLDLNSGFGQSSMQVNFVSRRGGNQFHGRAYEDFRNSGLNANSWENDAIGLNKNKLILNDFGGSADGPILRDKLFFFGSFAMSKQPGSFTAYNDVFTSAAQGGNFTYIGTDNQSHTVNVLALAQQTSPSLPGSVNSEVASQFSAINTATGLGKTATSSDPNFNSLQWINSSPTTIYYPAARVDYTMSQKVRMYLAWMMTKETQPDVTPANFPGPAFSNQIAGNESKNYSGSYGLDFIFSPRLLNQFKFGYLYDNTAFAYNTAPLYASQPSINWGYSTYGAISSANFNTGMSGQQYATPINTFYPILNASDSMTWQRAGHTLSFGFSWYREQDHYWNPPAGYPFFTLGLATGDPALQAFTNSGTNSTMPNASNTNLAEAGQLYAVLTGRINGASGQYAYDINKKQYNTGNISEYPLDEVSSATGIFVEDSWKVMPTLTLNYGLRWDFYSAEKDITGLYHSASPSAIYGPSGVGNLFNPGSLPGDPDPAITTRPSPYNPWKVTPQPAFGFAWNPHLSEGPLMAVFGKDNTVIRGGFALRRFTEPYQYFVDYATDFFSFYYQNFFLNPNNSGQTGTFSPGSLSIGGAIPAFGLSPTSYQASAPESQFTFQNSTGVNGLDPNVKQPYSESWNIGIQRGLGSSRALEIRYNGNRTIHQWLHTNPNEVNIFENGFLSEFKQAQQNLAASGGTSFAGTGSASLPIFNAAFGGPTASDFTNAQYIRYLQTGQAGAMANVLSGINGTVPYFCNLVGANFAPCANNAGYTGPGAGYPINFFQANPFAAGAQTGYMVAAGYSNYNALQVDFRQNAWNGLQFDANYTWSHSLGISTGNQGYFNYVPAANIYTLRNLKKAYGPSQFDLANVMHVNGTYDLPFGHGKQFLGSSNIADKVVGGWTLGTIVTFQSGAPTQLLGQFNTFNDYGDGGVRLNGINASQLQKAIGVHRIPGQNYADLINPKYLASAVGGGANSSYLTPNTTPGTIGDVPFLHGPHAFFEDMSVTKAIPIHERLHLRLQGEFLNVWNHPVFGNYTGNNASFDGGVQDYGFGTGQVTNETLGFGRIIELRGNIEF
jgi:hypothetical protein